MTSPRSSTTFVYRAQINIQPRRWLQSLARYVGSAEAAQLKNFIFFLSDFPSRIDNALANRIDPEKKIVKEEEVWRSAVLRARIHF